MRRPRQTGWRFETRQVRRDARSDLKLAEKLEHYDLLTAAMARGEALQRTTLTMWENDEDTCHGRFRIPALHGQMLTKLILALCSPTRSAAPALAADVEDLERDAVAHPGATARRRVG